MRTRLALLVGAVLLAGLALAGTSTAATADGSLDVPDGVTTNTTNETTNTTTTSQVGVCMIGLDSPCNGGGDATGSSVSTSTESESLLGRLLGIFAVLF